MKRHINQSRLQESTKLSLATCSTSLKTTEEADNCASGRDKSNDSRENDSVDSFTETEFVKRITQFYISTASGDSDAVKEARQEANSLKLKSMKCQPQFAKQ